VETGFGGTHRFPTLYTTKKIKDKKGLAFYSCPHFKDLRSDDVDKSTRESEAASRRISTKEFEKEVEKITEKEKAKKKKRKGARDPSIKEVRERLRKMVQYHKKEVQETIPCIYPILGPVNSDSDADDGGFGDKRGGPKMLNTKGELKKY